MKRWLAVVVVVGMLVGMLSGFTVYGEEANAVNVTADEDWERAYFKDGKLYNYNPDASGESGYGFSVSFGKAGTENIATITAITNPNVEKVVIPAAVVKDGISYEIRPGSNVIPANNTAVKSLIISEGVKVIGFRAFKTLNGVTQLKLPSTLTTLGGESFQLPNLEGSVVIPYGVTSIGNGDFAQCKKITHIEYPETITSYGNNLVDTCDALQSIKINFPVTAIKDFMFCRTANLAEYTIPETVTGTIGRSAFFRSGIAGEVVLPAGVTGIAQGAFGDCPNMTKVTIKGAAVSINENAFNGSGKLKTFVFEGMTAPTSTGTIINPAYTGITVYYPINGNGYDEQFRALFPEGTAFIATSAAPAVKGVQIEGKNVAGTQLTGFYTQFSDPMGGKESGSVAIWRRADDRECTQNVVEIQRSPIALGETAQYTLGTEDVGKYIQFAVIPKSDSEENNVGEEASTILQDAVRLPVTRPTVTLTAPSEGYRVHEGTPIGLSASAFCDNTEITKIEYYANDKKIAESSASPFDAEWKDAVPGEYALFARAYNGLEPAEYGDSEKVMIKVYDISESIEPVWAEKWSYDFNAFNAEGVYDRNNQLAGGLPGERAPAIVYQSGGSFQRAKGMFGKDSEDVHFRINSTSGGNERIRLSLPLEDLDAPIKTLVAEADVAVTTTDENHYFLGYRTSLASYNTISFLSNGKISYFNGSGSATTAFQNEDGSDMVYEPNRWYRVGIKLDFEKKTVSYYLDGKELLTREAPDPNRFEYTTEIRINGSHYTTQSGSVYIDNLFLGQVQDSYVNAVISTPTVGFYHLTGTDMQIKGYAKDSRPGCAVQKVEFLLDGLPFTETEGSSFDFKTAEIAPGHHILQAKAISADGMVGYSEKVPITVSAVKLPTMYHDDMLLQRNKPIRLGGEGKDGETVTASLCGASATAEISGGRWEIILPPQPANKSTQLALTTSDGVTISFDNVAIGELMLCSGQSNMQYRMEMFRNLSANADKDYPDIRLYNQTLTLYGAEKTDNPTGSWRIATVDQALRFSAMGYLVGKDYYLSQNGEVPVGLIYAAYGGAGINAFLPRGANKYDPDLREDGATYFNTAVAPWKYFTLGHVMWYQGESNTQMNYPYEKVLTHYVDSYRSAFRDEDLNFIMIQIPIYDYPGKYGGLRSGIGVREGQYHVSLHLPDVASVISMDTGDYGNIHPDDKMPLVHRTSLALQHFTNPEDDTLVWKSPSFDRYEVADETMTIYFKDVGTGMKTTDGAPPRGFTLAGGDGIYRETEAVLDGNTVKIDVTGVEGEPKVRYCYTDAVPLNGVRSALNLVNSEGLPLAMFRTDTDKYNFSVNNGDGTYSNPINFAPYVRWIKTEGDALIINARDYDGSIEKLEVYLDGTLLGTAEKAEGDTFCYDLRGVQPGTHRFHAIAIDNDGTISTQSHSTMGGRTVSPQSFSLVVEEAVIRFTDLSGKPIEGFADRDSIKAVAELAEGEKLVLAAYQDDTLLKMITAESGEVIFKKETIEKATQIKAMIWVGTEMDQLKPTGESRVLNP